MPKNTTKPRRYIPLWTDDDYAEAERDWAEVK